MSLKIYTLLSPLKKLFLFFKDYLIFSNTLLSSKSSNLFIKKHKDYFKVYSKKKPTLNALEFSQKKIFNFLKTKKIILPIYKNFFPGVGADYHYFGTIKTNKKSPISINNNCQLRKSKSIFIIDGSSLNFKNNFYPLGIIMANAKRIAKLFNK